MAIHSCSPLLEGHGGCRECDMLQSMLPGLLGSVSASTISCLSSLACLSRTEMGCQSNGVIQSHAQQIDFPGIDAPRTSMRMSHLYCTPRFCNDLERALPALGGTCN